MNFSKATAELVDTYRHAPGAEPLDFSRGGAYGRFIEAALACGYTGPNVETDVDFAARSVEWVASASEDDLRRWVHTLIRCDRWNGEYPTAILDACRAGCMEMLVERLSRSAGALHAGR